MNTTALLIILISVLGSYLWVNVLPFIWYIKQVIGKPNLKPFDCCLCLATWTATALVIIYWQGVLPSLGIVVATSFTAYFVERLSLRYL